MNRVLSIWLSFINLTCKEPLAGSSLYRCRIGKLIVHVTDVSVFVLKMTCERKPAESL